MTISNQNPHQGLVDLGLAFMLLAILATLSSFAMPSVSNAPTWANAPSYYISLIAVSSLLGLLITFIYSKWRNRNKSR